MKRGLVVGEVWATRKAPGLQGRSLKLIVEYPQPDKPSSSQFGDAALLWAPLIVAVDTLEARAGQEVLIAYGSGARNVLLAGPDNRAELCDAAVAMLPEPDPAGTTPSAGPSSASGPAPDPLLKA